MYVLKKGFLPVAALGFLAALLASSCLAARERPNILLIVLDDVAWRDLGSYGGNFDTPHLDRLAASGTRFTNAYSAAPICSASRVAIYTGKSPARSHFEFVTKWPDDEPKLEGHPLIPPPFTLNMPLEEVTIPEALAAAEYESAFFGKWHVSTHHRVYKGWSQTHGPKQQGFDVAEEDFGNHPYAADYPTVDPASFEAGSYPVDSMTERAVNYLGRDHSSPFFLMVAYYHVHTPVRAPTEWLKTKYLERLPADEQADRRSEYGAFVETMDHYVGRLLETLERENLDKETTVIVTSDNGGHPAYALHAPLRGCKWTVYEGGVRVPFIVRRGMQEGASVVDVPVIGTDLYSTIMDLAGLPSPEKPDSASIVPLIRGEEPTAELRERPLVWHFPYYNPEAFDPARRRGIGIDNNENALFTPMSAIRVGDYKLLRNYENHQVELYNLRDDISEAVNLAEQMPEKTRELQTALREYLSSVDARLPSLKY